MLANLFQLPWRSRPDLPWHSKAKKTLRRKNKMAAIKDVTLPVEQHEAATEQNKDVSLETPTTQASEPAVSSTPTHPASSVTKAASPTTPNARLRASTAKSATPTKPAIPQVALPTRTAPKTSPPKSADQPAKPAADEEKTGVEHTEAQASTSETQASEEKPALAPAPKPTSWANLFARKNQKGAIPNGTSEASSVSEDVPNGTSGGASTFPNTSASSLAEAIRGYKVNSAGKASYIEPRGLINTGNMCYMNSVMLHTLLWPDPR